LLSLFACPVAFTIVKGPKSMAFDKKRMKNFSVPCIRLVFDRWVVACWSRSQEEIIRHQSKWPQPTVVWSMASWHMLCQRQAWPGSLPCRVVQRRRCRRWYSGFQRVLERFVSVGEMLHEDSNVFADQSRIPRLDVAILGTS
jgi:hypothetical protein